jgi:hypothetical protein
MALTSRRSRPLDRGVAHLRDTRLLIIAAEGRETERQYFAMFRSTRVQVKVLSADDNRSAPEYVLERLRQFRDEYQLGEGDALWLMLDVDRWGDKKLAAIAQQATTSGFGLAVSHPCFEVWLLFHFSDQVPRAAKCAEVERTLREAIGGSYGKTRLEEARFRPFVRLAAGHSRPTPRHRAAGQTLLAAMSIRSSVFSSMTSASWIDAASGHIEMSQHVAPSVLQGLESPDTSDP